MANPAGLILTGVMLFVLIYYGASFIDNGSAMKPTAGSNLAALHGNETVIQSGVLSWLTFSPLVIMLLAFFVVLAVLAGKVG